MKYQPFPIPYNIEPPLGAYLGRELRSIADTLAKPVVVGEFGELPARPRKGQLAVYNDKLYCFGTNDWHEVASLEE